MANNKQGPRQPLSQRRPKVARAKASSRPRVGGLASKQPTSRSSSGKSKLVPPSARKSTAKPARKAGAKPAARRSLPSADPAVAYDRLLALYPDAHCELDFKTPFELLVATILSAQCTDKRVNMVTPVLFSRYPTVEGLAHARQEDVEEIIKSTGFFRNKAKSIIGMASAVVDRHGGVVPSTLDELVKLPGVGRKTANVVLGNAFDINEGVVVDTHVGRLATRLGLTSETDPVKVEQVLMGLFPPEHWTMLAHLLIFHGRRVCDAKNPRCGECTLADICPSSRV
jgi:endonuclease-3